MATATYEGFTRQVMLDCIGWVVGVLGVAFLLTLPL